MSNSMGICVKRSDSCNIFNTKLINFILARHNYKLNLYNLYDQCYLKVNTMLHTLQVFD